MGTRGAASCIRAPRLSVFTLHFLLTVAQKAPTSSPAPLSNCRPRASTYADSPGSPGSPAGWRPHGPPTRLRSKSRRAACANASRDRGSLPCCASCSSDDRGPPSGDWSMSPPLGPGFEGVGSVCWAWSSSARRWAGGENAWGAPDPPSERGEFGYEEKEGMLRLKRRGCVVVRKGETHCRLLGDRCGSRSRPASGGRVRGCRCS